MSKKAELENSPKEVTSSKIEAIKDLIFGENIAEYDSQFETLKDKILKNKSDLEHLIEVTQASLNESIDNLSTDLNIRITNVEEKIAERLDVLDDKKLDRKQLGDLLKKLGDKISE